MLALLLPGHGIRGDVRRLQQQSAHRHAIQTGLYQAAVAGWVLDRPHHGRSGGGEEPQQANRPGQLAHGQVGQTLQREDFDGQGFHAGLDLN
jgi:hypothetical protein